MLVGFFGSRNGCPPYAVERIFQKLREKSSDITVVVGDCIGVDQQVCEYCKAHGIPVKVIAVCNNWSKISYRPHSDDVIETIGSPNETLRVRLVKRTQRIVEYVKSQNGFLVGINTRGSQRAIRTAKQLSVPVSLIY
jgi:hypothetical protein